MFQTLDAMLSLAVVFLILSMVNKYLMSIVKRLLRVKANVAAEEMKTFIGDNTIKVLVPFLDAKARHLNFLAKTKKGRKGVRQLTHEQLDGLVDSLSEFLKDKKNIQDVEGALENISIPGVDIDAVKTHLGTLKKRIRYMYDSTLEDMSEVYTNKLRTITLISGILLALFINADFFDIFNSVSKNAVVRERLVAQADMIRNHTSELSAGLKDKEGVEIKEIKKDVDNTTENISALIKNIDEAGLQLGWTKAKFNKLSGLSILSKLSGLIISGLLISFGAPFWHDFLSSISGIRKKLLPASGKPGLSSTQEKRE